MHTCNWQVCVVLQHYMQCHMYLTLAKLLNEIFCTRKINRTTQLFVARALKGGCNQRPNIGLYNNRHSSTILLLIYILYIYIYNIYIF